MARAREKLWLVADRLYVYERDENDLFRLPTRDELRVPSKEDLKEFKERLEVDRYYCPKCGQLFWKGGNYGFDRDYPEDTCTNCYHKAIKWTML